MSCRTDDQTRRAVAIAVRDSVVPATIIAMLAFGSTALVHSMAMPPDAARVVAGFELASALLLLIAVLIWRRRPVSLARAPFYVTAILSLVLCSSGLYHHFDRSPDYTFGPYIVVLVAGGLLLSWPWFAAVILSSSGLFCWIVYSSSAALTLWSNAVAMMAAVSAAAAAIFTVRLRSVRMLEGLRQVNERARTRLEQSYRALEWSEARYRQLTENASDVVVEIGPDARLCFASPSVSEALGYEPAELLGWHFDEALSLENGRSYDSIQAESAPGSMPKVMLARARHRDGSERWFDCHARAFEVSEGKQHVVAVCRDVTQRKREDEAQERGREQLEALVDERTQALHDSLEELRRAERLASVGTLAAGIAHQVNNPVGAILASAQYALMCSGDVDEHSVWRSSLVDITEHAKRCGEIVRGVLRFARSEPVDKVATDLGEVARRAYEITLYYARQRKATLVFVAADRPFVVSMSPIEVEEALINLIRNAIESRDAGVKVQVVVEGDQELARVQVIDDGRGLDRAEQARIFDPFFTARLAAGGTGLGLSVAHGIVVDHGGALRVESEPGRGTTMTLELPLVSKAL